VFGIPLRSGRSLSPTLDRPGDTPTAVVNEAFVKKFVPAGLEPTAQRIDSDPNPKNWTRIVGVVGNVRQNIYEPSMPEHDYLIDSLPVKEHADILNGMTLVLRFEGDPGPIALALRNALQEVDPTVPFKEAKTVSAVVSETLIFERMESWLFGIFAGLALALALVGLYGLLSHEVELSTRDIGLRMALGASRPKVVGMVQKTINIVIYVDTQKESGTLLMTALVLVAAGVTAAMIPARRAASIDPMQALRAE
jgi:hypothetical protein